ncbi:regulator of G-protein signaling 9-binding protein-like [Lytechinus variegatus]|uniref:regulator of G-protein signaling 9-binding protein-like n=1 Tax=Lytechinus variegatus TaxID=7654 RepID=UPI001BB2A59E|nr:regulator of G-protein signaling 9-binding protein-like [Lytechinus variegatus]XP_041464214.1 regulator of G-protein signaling 9-binding protein-like [Lytechinus variegatus]XP_041464215.1 regulator of G-protein signaling 9-binding protein-like [Lytechinus variegatus]
MNALQFGKNMIRRHNSCNRNHSEEHTGIQSDPDTDEIEDCGMPLCTKLVKEFNIETARYHDLTLTLGGSSDSEYLRDELKRTRKNAFDLAKKSMRKLLPHLKDKFDFKAERSEYERLWNMFSACLEVFEGHMRKSLELVKSFPIHAGNKVLINTGVMEPLGVDNIPVNVENLDIPCVDKMVLEREDTRLLERDILELRNLMSEMHRRVDIKPWTIQPPSDYKLDTKSQTSLNSETASSTGFDPQYDARQRRKCAFLVSVALITLLAFAAILIICLVLLEGK